MKTITLTFPADSVEFTTGEQTFVIPVEMIPPESALRIFMYGRRMFNDYVNSAVNRAGEAWKEAKPEARKHSSEAEAKLAARVKASEDWFASMRDGKLGESRASAADELTMELRTIVGGYLKSAGIKAKDAVELAKDPRAGFRRLLVLSLTAKFRGTEPTAEKVEEAFSENWPNVEAAALRAIEARKPVSLSI